MKRTKSINDANGRPVGVQHIDDSPTMPFIAPDKIETAGFNCSIGHPLGVHMTSYGAVASPMFGYCIGSANDPFANFKDEEVLHSAVEAFNKLLTWAPPGECNLMGRVFDIRNAVSYYCITAGLYKVAVYVKCTNLVKQYLETWNWMLTGSAHFDSEIGKIYYLKITGISVCDYTSDNMNVTIPLITYT